VLASDKAPIDFVRILLFEDFTQVVNQKALSETPVPPPTGGPIASDAPRSGDSISPAAVTPALTAKAAAAAPPPAARKPKAADAAKPVKKPDAKATSAKADPPLKPATPAKPKPKPPAGGTQP
jgi:rod shape-determining protein MreC